ncbi:MULTISPECIES: amidohydrolase family protein [unclassified Amycolatopsis]|uniref:amidohydrolase family protein n=1 Tax=unclassified Amycolatopsis TaxID=2618356 RepID=UPI0028765383|nr:MULTISPECIES: amidohydrolase family protein [unclassified Amycolatopsis]MDS0139509.1 amidohydrolase family protein [Amycolatopsis sp. 505]MDS0147088.1 amidohydrolase family protein [Amycolatopsis sp. CM201R]
MPGLLLRDGRPWRTTGPADLLVRDGVITAIGPGIGAEDAGDAEVVELGGRLVLPGLVEAHCHLDKTLYGGPWRPHSAGPALADRIADERLRRTELGLPDPARVSALLETMAAAGTTHVRTHTDVYAGTGLTGVEVVRDAAARLAGRISVEQVAFPQSGILGNPGTAALLEEAIKLGVHAVGGIDPAGMDRDPVRHLDVVFGLAERHGVRIDLHLHDPGSLGVFELELIIDRTRAAGLAGRVTVSHAYALGQADAATQDRLAAGLAEAGITITTAAVFDFPVPPVQKLRAAGVNVACGHDDIRDLWSPYGSGDLLDRAMHLAYRSTFRRDEDIEMALEAVTYGGAKALGLTGYGLAEGAPADLVVVDAETPAHAVVTRPPRDLVVKAGHIVARGKALSPPPAR